MSKDVYDSRPVAANQRGITDVRAAVIEHALSYDTIEKGSSADL